MSDLRQPRPRIALWFRVALLATTVLLGLCLMEGAVRLYEWKRYGTVTGAGFELVLDPATGLHIPKPGQTVRGIRINSQGFRGPEISRVKPPQTVRLAFLGGSTTFCAEVSSNEATWPSLVWKRPCRAASSRVSAIKSLVAS